MDQILCVSTDTYGQKERQAKPIHISGMWLQVMHDATILSKVTLQNHVPEHK